MITYFVLLCPMLLGYSIVGFVAGWFVGRYHWGKIGGVALAAILGLSPLAAGVAADMILLERLTDPHRTSEVSTPALRHPGQARGYMTIPTPTRSSPAACC